MSFASRYVAGLTCAVAFGGAWHIRAQRGPALVSAGVATGATPTDRPNWR